MLNYKKNKRIINIAIITISLILIALIYLNVKTVRSLINLIFFSFILAYILKPLKELLIIQKSSHIEPTNRYLSPLLIWQSNWLL